MKIVFCDRCNNHITGKVYEIEVGSIKGELCANCVSEAEKAIRSIIKEIK